MTSQTRANPIPIILDTDIGWDIDDTWALVMMLNSPELDVKLILTDTGDTLYRAKIVAKLLEAAGRVDIPIGVGLRQDDLAGPQAQWVKGYDLERYPGIVHREGVRTLVDMIMSSPEPMTLVSIAPLPNIAAALDMEPRIAERARFIGMHGSLRRGYGGSAEIAAEYNVKVETPACQKVFTAPWDITITPLDTCGIVSLHNEKYLRVRNCATPLVQALLENIRIWAKHISPDWLNKLDVETDSSTLFDTVAIYLAFSEDLLVMEQLGIQVTDEAYTVIDDQAKMINCATGWKDLGAFEDLLVTRILGREKT
jgi:inosine-uridine nucleoside N-ribohydrolase